jgi:hypothetical protein
MNIAKKQFAILTDALRRRGAMLVFSALASAFIPSAQATLSYVNGNFGTLNCGVVQTTCTDGAGELGYNTDVTGWVNQSSGGNLGYNFLYTGAVSATSGANGESGSVALWPGAGPTLTAPPAGGPNFIAADGAYHAAAIQQTITGVVSGATYAVGFYWAGAQQNGFTGPTTEQWQVTLTDGTNSKTVSTNVLPNTSQGFTGWFHELITFTATSSTETLSFLSVGTPISPSEPPFALLADVSFSQTPEPGSLGLMIGGISLIAIARIRRSKVR